MEKQQKTPLHIMGKDCNSADPISSNPLYILCEMEFRVEMLTKFKSNKKMEGTASETQETLRIEMIKKNLEMSKKAFIG